jgi:hypothetical protein
LKFLTPVNSTWWMTHVVLKVVTCTDFSDIGPLDPWIQH